MSFKLNPEAGMVFLPGHGRVRPGELLMGEKWRRYTPGLLVEVPDPKPAPPVETRAPEKKAVERPEPVVVPPLEAQEEPVTSQDKKVLTEAKPRKPSPADAPKFSRRRGKGR